MVSLLGTHRVQLPWEMQPGRLQGLCLECLFPKILITNELSCLNHSTPFFSLLPLPILTSLQWKRYKKKVQLLFVSTDWQTHAHLDAFFWMEQRHEHLHPVQGFPHPRKFFLSLAAKSGLICSGICCHAVPHSSEHHPRPPPQSRETNKRFQGRFIHTNLNP